MSALHLNNHSTNLGVICIEFLSYWRSGTGRGEGVHLDASSRRDALGLPMLPGRQIKGLIRHALMTGAQWGHWSFDVVDQLCGIGKIGGSDRHQDLDRFSTVEGAISVSSGRLSLPWIRYFEALSKDEAARQYSHFFHVQRQTKIQANGLAEDHSLRSLEVCIPVTLYSKIQIATDSNEEYFTYLKKAARLIRSAGSQTSRGLGRVSCTLEEYGTQYEEII